MPDRRNYTKEEVQEKVSFAEMRKDVSVIRQQVEKLTASFEAAEAKYVTKEEYVGVPEAITALNDFKNRWIGITIAVQVAVIPLVLYIFSKLYPHR